MERSGMWGYGKGDPMKSCKDERIYRSFRTLLPLPSHKPYIPLRCMWG
ncbi:hypothetical protein Barb4_03574 [Bacteroidales bacterium Barb4]|nr:hypothetical protein Barb4_03574 [Bacteroidales bacterium Barb4]